MIPDPDEILAGYRFAVRRWNLRESPSAAGVRAAVEDARELAAGDASLEPAAVFFAFARRPRVFPGAWRLMPALLALNQARAIGKRLRTDRDEMNGLLVRIAKRDLEFPDVIGWFRARLVD